MQKTLSLKNILLIALVATVLIACKKNEKQYNQNADQLIGNWIDPQYGDSTITLKRAGDLSENGYGISFRVENALLEHKNTGWCGTPPITYGDFNGNWTRNDSLILITVAYWGGVAEYRWVIKSLNSHQLKVLRLGEEYHEDSK